ncbi:MAG: hypothetical protein E7672_00660 [Ruminococcaceae bacterium]|nr:hypothetical protein [Oscillospiraceae bacterium]
MKALTKIPGKDFNILTLSDPQLGDSEWGKHSRARLILEYTVREMIERVHPDLITTTGDIARASQDKSYRCFAEFINSLGIPWATVWGNHDNEYGPEYIDIIADMYMEFDNCLFEKGDRSLGNGNYVIRIEENGKPVHGVFMIDSHDKDDYINAAGERSRVYSRLTPAQLEWYRAECKKLSDDGCNDTSIFLHIPIYAYREAWAAAYKTGIVESPKMISVEESYTDKFWNDGYTDSFGVLYEGICSYPEDDGVFSAMKECGSTRHIVAGHDHTNNFVIKHEGIKFIYGTKTGEGNYWNESVNGGTVLTIGSDGIKDVHHEIVDVSHML